MLMLEGVGQDGGVNVMVISMENVLVYIGIITFVVTTVRCFLIAPIKEGMDEMRDAIQKLQDSIGKLGSIINEQSNRITIVEQQAKAIRFRLDKVEAHAKDS